MFTTNYYPKNKKQLIDCVKEIFDNLKKEAPYGRYESLLTYENYDLKVKYDAESANSGFGGVFFMKGDNYLVNENLFWDLLGENDEDFYELYEEEFFANVDYIYDELLNSIEGNIE